MWFVDSGTIGMDFTCASPIVSLYAADDFGTSCAYAVKRVAWTGCASPVYRRNHCHHR